MNKLLIPFELAMVEASHHVLRRLYAYRARSSSSVWHPWLIDLPFQDSSSPRGLAWCSTPPERTRLFSFLTFQSQDPIPVKCSSSLTVPTPSFLFPLLFQLVVAELGVSSFRASLGSVSHPILNILICVNTAVSDTLSWSCVFFYDTMLSSFILSKTGEWWSCHTGPLCSAYGIWYCLRCFW